MVNYGSVDYWNERYANDVNNPFDWLFDFKDVDQVLSSLIDDKMAKILLPGCGNAPFSPDLYFAGDYKNLYNIDISTVVIEQMKKKYPEIRWSVMDVLNLQFPDGFFPFIVDKSLIDTLMCYPNSIVNTKQMLAEMYRVMEDGGRCISFSLHAMEEAQAYYVNAGLNWRVRSFRLKSSRWNEDKNRKRAVAHTMIICDKPLPNGEYRLDVPDKLHGALSEEEYKDLLAYAQEVNFKAALRNASSRDLGQLLDLALLNTLKKPDKVSSSSSDSLVDDKIPKVSIEEDNHVTCTVDSDPALVKTFDSCLNGQPVVSN